MVFDLFVVNVNGCTCYSGSSVKRFYLPSKKVSILKGRNFFLGSKLFAIGLDSNPKGAWYIESKYEVTKVVSI